MTPLNARFVRHLQAGGTLVTASRRQARLIQRLYDRAQQQAGRTVWPSADVLPLSAWAEARWGELEAAGVELPVLLTESQCAWPWRLQASQSTEDALIAADDLGTAARRAWVRLQQFGGTLADLQDLPLTRDQSRFLEWATAVESAQHAAGWLDPGALDTALAARAGRLAVAGPLCIAGFVNLPPAVRRLADALAAAGWQVEFAPLGLTDGVRRVCPAADVEAEAAALVHWARERMLAEPEGRFAAIVPDLASRRAALERLFEAHLQPELELPGQTGRNRVFDFAGGPDLAGIAVVEAALAALAATAVHIEADVLSRVLRNRYLGDPEELEGRVRLDLSLRSTGLRRWPLGVVRERAAEHCPAFAGGLEQAARVLEACPARQTTDAWARAFGSALAAWGWPGRAALASDEYQAAQAFRERLAELAALARTAPVLTRAAVARELQRLCQQAFQPERGEAGCFVLDVHEAPGLEFDGLWVSGLTASAWPRAAAPDPFLPISLQARLGMPEATPALALAQAEAVTSAWQAGAAEVVFSWPLSQDDTQVEPSRLIDTRLSELTPAATLTTRVATLFAARRLETLSHDPAPPLRPHAARGGARILELQAKCPFRAFAELRLAAESFEDPAGGIDARVRGVVLHRALESVWNRLGGSQGLAAEDQAGLAALIEQAVRKALARTVPADVGPRALALELAWQCRAIDAELEHERDRPPFQVLSTETDVESTLAGLPLRLRVDRMDRIGEETVILDYKTGRAQLSSWRGARPDAPQLPLYAVLESDRVGAIAFVAVGAGQSRSLGLARDPEVMPGLETVESFQLTDAKEKGFDWETTRQRWAGWLGSLAAAHLAGEARVDPKTPATCRNCHLPTLCRVGPDADEQDEEGGDD